MNNKPLRHPFQLPSFSIWLASRFCSNMAKQMLVLIISWQVYQLTHDPLALGFIGLAEALPFMAASLWAGPVVDHSEKKTVMVSAVLGLTLCASVLWTTSYLENPSPLIYYAIMVVVGAFSSFEHTSNMSYVQTIVPEGIYPKAAAWNLTSFQSGLIAGPIAAGWILSKFGLGIACLSVAITALTAVVLAGSVQKAPPAQTGKGGIHLPVAALKEGIRFILKERLILACMALDMFAMLFGDCVGIFPIFAERHGVGPVGLGLLRAAPSIGSLVMSLVATQYHFFTPSWTTLRIAVIVFGVSIISFSLSPFFGLALVFLITGGMADSISVITRQSLYQAMTPVHLRGRINAVNGIFLSTSNELGSFESGLVARLIGAVPSVVVGGLMTLLSVAVMSSLYNRWTRQKTESA